jgi:hypothetical protein
MPLRGPRKVVAAAKVTPPAKDSEILLPGEIEVRTREQRSREGIALPDATWRDLEGVARKLDIKMPEEMNEYNVSERGISRLHQNSAPRLPAESIPRKAKAVEAAEIQKILELRPVIPDWLEAVLQKKGCEVIDREWDS